MKTLTKEKIHELVQCWIADALADDDFKRTISKRPYRSLDNPYGEGNWEVTGCEEALDYFRTIEVTRDYTKITPDVDELLQKHDFTAKTDSYEYIKLCDELIKGQQKFYELLKRRILGESITYIPEHKQQSRPITDNTPQHKYADITMSEAIQQFKDKKNKEEWKPVAAEHAEMMLDRFIEMTGDINVVDISKDLLENINDFMRKYPKNITKLGKYRKGGTTTGERLPMNNIMKMNIPEADRLGPVTINNYIVQFNGFLSWTQKYYELTDKPWLSDIIKPVKLDKNKRKNKSKGLFTQEDLHKFFIDYVPYTEGKAQQKNRMQKPHMFWMPLIGLFTGCRTEEAAQLYLKDFKISKEGIKYIDFTETIDDEDGKNIKVQKRIKSYAGIRSVPIHKELLKLGLWEYVEELKAKGHERLFEDLPLIKAAGGILKYSKNFSRWFPRQLHYAGITNEVNEGNKSFYSFRKTFIDYCAQHRFDRELYQRIVGHEHGDSVTELVYEGDMNLRTLQAEIIDRIDYGIDLSHLRKNKYSRPPI